MCIGEVRMGVCLRLVAVPVGVSCARSDRFAVGMAMVLVVHVFMLVLQRFVHVLVPFGQMEPHARYHQGACNDQAHAH